MSICIKNTQIIYSIFSLSATLVICINFGLDLRHYKVLAHFRLSSVRLKRESPYYRTYSFERWMQWYWQLNWLISSWKWTNWWMFELYISWYHFRRSVKWSATNWWWRREHVQGYDNNQSISKNSERRMQHRLCIWWLLWWRKRTSLATVIDTLYLT